MLKELQNARYFDSFSYNAQINRWACFSCAHPERVWNVLQMHKSGIPLLEGELKEKRGRWKFLKRWHTKYFTLSSAALIRANKIATEKGDPTENPPIDLRKIRSVKSLNRGHRSRKSLPKFEVFTDDKTSYVLKASDRKKAEEWFQCLQIAVAQAQKEENNIN
ncbi:PH domain-containing protein [Ditylenchus destructor]|uniref:PH domain-containing protein n=1 Tax=Ditylenchus destructor TaxID=166010 RepID=A0AAD4NCQ8_9BILA|nr:PH domain-containing protein [Ditylenchus destructor]